MASKPYTPVSASLSGQESSCNNSNSKEGGGAKPKEGKEGKKPKEAKPKKGPKPALANGDAAGERCGSNSQDACRASLLISSLLPNSELA